MKQLATITTVLFMVAGCKPEVTKTVKIINNSTYTVSFHFTPIQGGTNTGYNVIPNETEVVSYTVERAQLTEDSCCACVREWGLVVVNDTMKFTKDIKDESEWTRELFEKGKGGDVNCTFEFTDGDIEKKI